MGTRKGRVRAVFSLCKVFSLLSEVLQARGVEKQPRRGNFCLFLLAENTLLSCFPFLYTGGGRFRWHSKEKIPNVTARATQEKWSNREDRGNFPAES